MKHRILILVALLSTAMSGAFAQTFSYNETNNLFYFARRSPQTNMLNPALFPESNSFYLNLPALNGLQLGLPLSVHDIAQYDSTVGANVISINRVLDTLNQDSRIRTGFDINLLGFGFKIHRLFFDFYTSLRGNLGISLPMTVINTVMQGNVDNGNPIPEATLINGDLFNTQAYLETSVGAGFRLPVLPLTIGVHAKLLSGIFNVQMDNTKVTFETEEDFETVRARIYYELLGSSILPIDTTAGMDQIVRSAIDNIIHDPMSLLKSAIDLSGGNTGVAFDIGVRYDIKDFITLSASINDLSAGIHWQNNLIAIVPTDGMTAIEFDGIDLGHILDNGNINVDTLGAYLSDQLNGMKPKLLLNEGDYWYNIPTKVNLAATINLTHLFRFGVLFHGQFDRGLLSKNTFANLTELASDARLNYGELKNTFRFNTTLSAGFNLGNWIEVLAASSFVYDGTQIGLKNFLNPGVGLILTPGATTQFYAMLDYASSIYLSQMKAFNLKFGFNMLIGRGGKHRLL